MTMHVNVSGTWKEITAPSVNVSGTWKAINEGWVNVSGTWKQFFTAFTESTQSITSGSGTLTAPTGANRADFKVEGSGGVDGADQFGYFGGAGGSGGQAVKNGVVVVAGETLSYAISDGEASISGTLASGSISMTANPGGDGGDAQDDGNGSPGGNGTASGGTTNTTGGANNGGGGSPLVYVRWYRA